MTNKRQLQKEATKKLIIQTAYEVYGEKGFSISTSEIAKAAGVSHGTIFSHFPTVSAMLQFLIDDFGAVLTNQLHQESVKVNNLRAFLTMHMDLIAEHEAFYHRLITDMHFLPEESKLSFLCLQSAVSFHLGKTIERLQSESGVIDVPRYMIFNMWIGLLHYYLQNQEYFTADGSVLQNRKEELIDSFMKMITQN